MSEVRRVVELPASPDEVWPELFGAGSRLGLDGLRDHPGAEGDAGPVRWRVLDVEPGRRLTLGWREPAAESTVEVLLTRSGGGTRLAIVHRGAPPSSLPALRRRWGEVGRRPRRWGWVVAAVAATALVGVVAVVAWPRGAPVPAAAPAAAPAVEPAPVHPVVDPPGVVLAEPRAWHASAPTWARDGRSLTWDVGVLGGDGVRLRAELGPGGLGPPVMVGPAQDRSAARGAIVSWSSRSPDGTRTVVQVGRGQAADVWEEKGSGAWAVDAGPGAQERPVVTADGAVWAFEQLDRGATDLVRLAPDRAVVVRGVRFPLGAAPATSADGTWLAVVPDDPAQAGVVVLVRARDGALVPVETGLAHVADPAVWVNGERMLLAVTHLAPGESWRSVAVVDVP